MEPKWQVHDKEIPLETDDGISGFRVPGASGVYRVPRCRKVIDLGGLGLFCQLPPFVVGIVQLVLIE